MPDGRSQTTRSRPRSSSFDEADMIGDLRERLAVVETTQDHHAEMIQAQRSRLESGSARFDLIEGRVTRNERTIETQAAVVALVPPTVERVQRLEQAQDTSAQVKAAHDSAVAQAAEQRKQAMQLVQWIAALVVMAAAAAKGVSGETISQILKALGALVPGR